MRMRYVFFGTSEFSTIILEKLIKAGFVPAVIVCNPDRPVGRKQIITPPLTKLLAVKNNVTVLQPEILSNSKSEIQNSKPDLFIVAVYAKIIPKEILSIPRLGTIGAHPSLLPKYRGASPIQTTILNGDKKTGITLYLLDEKVDHGPIISKSEIRISKSETYNSLHNKLAILSAEILIETLPKFLKGEIVPQPQDESLATYTKKFATENAYVDPEDLNKAQNGTNLEKAEIIERKIRALNPEPGVWTILDQEIISLIRANKSCIGKRMKILEAEIKDNKLILKKIQLEGRKPQILV